MDKIYDMIIIGGGPGGYTAALYGARAGLATLVMEKMAVGGQMSLTDQIDNYPGFEEGIEGLSLGEKMKNEAERFGARTVFATVLSADLKSDPKVIKTSDDIFYGRTVVIATGAEPRELGVAMEKELVGRGVSYCATCDGALYRGRRTVVIGYSRDEEKEADFLSELADEVIYIPMYQEFSPWNNKVKVLQNVTPVGMEKENDHLVLKLQEQSIPTDGIFILRDQVAPSQLVPGLQIENNQVIVDRGCRTNIAGLFACGDITGAPYQYIKAAGEGNVAALSAVNYLADQKQVQ